MLEVLNFSDSQILKFSNLSSLSNLSNFSNPQILKSSNPQILKFEIHPLFVPGNVNGPAALGLHTVAQSVEGGAFAMDEVCHRRRAGKPAQPPYDLARIGVR